VSYSATVLADSPIAYYRLDDTNTAAVDSSGNGYNGTYEGTYTQSVTGLIAGDSDKATTFAGGDVILQVPYSAGPTYTTTGGFSWECWIKGSGNSGNVVLYGTDFWLGLSSGVPSYNGSLNGPTSIDDGAIHHVVLTRASGVLKIYVDGSVVATGGGGNTDAVGSGIAPHHTDIAALHDGGSFHYSGTIDEFAVYNYALTQAQVSNHYTAGSSGGGGGGATSYMAPASPTTIAVNTSTTATITPNGTYTGTITGTPAGSASTGLSPITKTFSGSSSPQTASWTPTITGTLTIAWTNSGGLTDPGNDTISVTNVRSVCVCLGDSLTIGYGASTGEDTQGAVVGSSSTTYPGALARALGATVWDTINSGHDGDNLSQM
jgi:hypothetical protein